MRRIRLYELRIEFNVINFGLNGVRMNFPMLIARSGAECEFLSLRWMILTPRVSTHKVTWG